MQDIPPSEKAAGAGWTHSAMADRSCLKIPAGQRFTHSIPCNWQEGEDGNTRAVALGSLDWNAVSLGEKTIDLEVYVLLKSEDGSEAPTIHYLKQKGSGRSFAGRFVPQEDARFLTEGGNVVELDSVIFEFDNSYSWWTEKEVELITIRTACSANLPPPLPEKAPHSLPPRATTPHGAATQKAQEIPDLRKAMDAGNDEKRCAFRFIQHLEGLLEAAEAKCPKEGLQLAGAEALWSELLQLRQSCQEALKLQKGKEQDISRKTVQIPAAEAEATRTSEEKVVEAEA